MISYFLKEPYILFENDIPLKYTLNNDEALVQIFNVSLCGSDYALFKGIYSGPTKYPLVLGHEWSGKIIDIHSVSTKFSIGDIVTGDCSNWGNQCLLKDTCEFNKNTCPSVEKYGISKDGFLREYAVVPLHNLYVAPQDIDCRLLAMTEFFSVALNSIKNSFIQKYLNKNYKSCIKYNLDKSILIIGAGPIGVSIYLLLKYMFKIDNILMLEKSIERIDYVKSKFPNIKFISNLSTSNTNDYSNILLQTNYNIIFEATGSCEALNMSLSLINPNGNIVLIGMYPNSKINIKTVVLKSLTLSGNIGGTGSFNEVIDFIYHNQNLVSKMISNEIHFNKTSISNILSTNNKRFLKNIINVSKNI